MIRMRGTHTRQSIFTRSGLPPPLAAVRTNYMKAPPAIKLKSRGRSFTPPLFWRNLRMSCLQLWGAVSRRSRVPSRWHMQVGQLWAFAIICPFLSTPFAILWRGTCDVV